VTDSWIPLCDAVAPIIERLKPTVSRENIHLVFIELDEAIDALERFGSVIEKPVGSLRAVRSGFAELFGYPLA
jgi:hypothetical protein